MILVHLKDVTVLPSGSATFAIRREIVSTKFLPI